MYANNYGYIYLEGNTSQSECLEISLGSLHSTQDKAFFTGTDVVLPVAVKWTHTEGKRRNTVVRTALLQYECFILFVLINLY